MDVYFWLCVCCLVGVGVDGVVGNYLEVVNIGEIMFRMKYVFVGLLLVSGV